MLRFAIDLKNLLVIFILFVSFNLFTVECIRTFKFTKSNSSINRTNNATNSLPTEEIRHGFEDAVFITDVSVFYHQIEAYSNSAHPDFNFIIIANSYFPIVTPPPLLG